MLLRGKKGRNVSGYSYLAFIRIFVKSSGFLHNAQPIIALN